MAAKIIEEFRKTQQVGPGPYAPRTLESVLREQSERSWDRTHRFRLSPRNSGFPNFSTSICTLRLRGGAGGVILQLSTPFTGSKHFKHE